MLEVQDDTPQHVHSVSLTGTGAGNVPPAALNPPEADFGRVAIGDVVFVEFTLTSTDPAPLNVKSSTVLEDNPSRSGPTFSMVKDGCTGSQLAPGGSCGVVVGFSPLEAGDRQATLTILVDAPIDQVTASLFSST
jgi:hypothetical protein